MKSLLLLVLFFLSVNCAWAQSKTDQLYNTWVLSKVSYKDGSELPDSHPLKYIYLKYKFSYPDKFNAAAIFYENGIDRSFEINNEYLILKSPEGPVINTLKIIGLSDKLVLLQPERDGTDSPTSLLFTFVPEDDYQKSISLKPGDIRSVFGSDTTYIESPKIYATYKGASFQRYIYDGISGQITMQDRVGHFVASFVVSKTGIADSVTILEHLEPDFDKRFIKVFNQAKKNWKPAVLNGKYVSVVMKVELRYSTSATTIPAYFAGQKALEAYNNKNYDQAIYFYDEAIATEPGDKDFLLKRGMCKLLLGNNAAACEDWNKAKALGSDTTIDALLGKYCR